MTLLQQAESAKGKNPTQGITALDSLLLQEDPSNFSKLESAASPFSNLTSYLSSTQQGLDTAAQSAAQEAAATQQKMRDAYVGAGGIVPTFNQGVNDAMQNASQKVTGYNQNIADIISDLNAGKALTNSYPDWDASNVDPSGTLSTLNPYGTSGGVFPSMLAMGLGAGVGPNYLTQFYNAPNQVAQPGLENVMTPEQWADAQALNQLIGPGTAQAPAALGQQFQVPSGYGSFDSQGALNGLYNSLKAQEAELPYMTQEQQSAWLGNMQLLGSYLGIPSTNYPNPQPISGTPPPPPGTGPGLGEGGGPPYLQPPVPGGGGDVSGGGRRFYSMGVS
jgi:hypothetical protein